MDKGSFQGMGVGIDFTHEAQE